MAVIQKTVEAAGTPESIGSAPAKWVYVYPLPDNVGNVYVKDAADVTATNGAILGPSSPPVLFWLAGNVSELYVDAANSDDGVFAILVG